MHRNTSTTPIDLASGRIVQPGDDVDLGSEVDEHDQAHIDAGRLKPLTKSSRPAPEPTEPSMTSRKTSTTTDTAKES